MIKKVLHIAIWLLLACWFTLIMGFVSKNDRSLLCRQIVINISDSTDIKFVTSNAIRKLLLQSGHNLQGYPLEEINTRDLEYMLEKDPYIENAEVYTTINGDLFVDIMQRKPLIRVMPGGKEGYYIDHNGVILPLTLNYSPMILLLSGKIEFPLVAEKNGVKRADTAKDKELQELIGFAKLVNTDKFWNKQIVQLYRDKYGEYEIIPRVGAHQILFGVLDNYENKLQNLKLLYNQGFKQYGWNTYDKINLKYSNQIICTKR